MKHLRILSLCALSSMVVSLSYAREIVIGNRFPGPARVTVTYQGETSHSCRKDKVVLASGSAVWIEAGICIISSIQVEGGYTLSDPSGRSFVIKPDGTIVTEDEYNKTKR